ncbi:MAG: diphosphomevalonate decarboxylase [Woeseiaceae bacterium]|nr:diphosphomevalonate decarboxylase [Woeseiaceae bacterium]
MRVSARAHPNIALVKYWGKRDSERNLPAVGSISITLGDLWTDMTIDTDADGNELTVNGKSAEDMLPRVSAGLDKIFGPGRSPVSVTSESNFPIAAGLASSASAFASLVVSAFAASEQDVDRDEMANVAGSFSGSAARSLYDGFVELENDDDRVVVRSIRDADSWPLSVVIAITSSARKSVGSGEAMETSRRTSPFYVRWVEEQDEDLARARKAILERDFPTLADVAEHNCLKMHSVMWTSRPPMVYWNPATIECMHVVRSLRADGASVFFTIDAGPQVKAVCLPEDVDRVREALGGVEGVESIMTSGLGAGAHLIE